MKNKEINELTIEELKDKLQEKQAELSKLKISHAIAQIENPMLIPQTKKTVARLKTAITSHKSKASNK